MYTFLFNEHLIGVCYRNKSRLPCVLGEWVICLWQILNKILTAFGIFSTFWDVFNALPLEISVTKEFKRLVWYHCIFLLRL